MVSLNALNSHLQQLRFDLPNVAVQSLKDIFRLVWTVSKDGGMNELL